MLGGKTSEQWIEEYSHSHQHPINKLTHKIGIPMIALSLPLFPVAIFVKNFWIVPVVLFVIGWIFQFVGHAIEGNQPAFFKNPMYLLVGPAWFFRRLGAALGLSKSSAHK